MTPSDSTTTSGHSTVLGYPRIGKNRELKRATEAYWKKSIGADELQKVARELRAEVWTTLRDAGIAEIPSNTFSFYDHVADLTEQFGIVPDRFIRDDRLSTFFAMTRGDDKNDPLEMTKWFDTNYHYLVPEISPDTTFALSGTKVLDEFNEAKQLGIVTRPVLVGPVTFLLLSKDSSQTSGFSPIDKLDELIDIYVEILSQLKDAGCEWVQLDEPAFVKDQPKEVLDALARCYKRLGETTARPKILVASYFGTLDNALDVLALAPIEGLAIDFSGRAPEALEQVLANGNLKNKRIVAGVVDGRNVWINDLTKSLSILNALSEITDDLVVSSSSSLLHVPITIEGDNKVDEHVRPWLAFAQQKLREVALLSQALRDGEASVSKELEANKSALADRQSSSYITDPAVRSRLQSIKPSDDQRTSAYEQRKKVQDDKLTLPDLPTTTIGSFPQTTEIRTARASFQRGEIDQATYEQRLRDEIAHVVELQEKIGLDVLVHGEAERNDMVQYFAEQLTGCVFTDNGWVQSYGTRYVRPPIIAGDISRPEPMTVRWATYAQSLTNHPMKGMLTGPVTMLCWSFVRDDQPWADTARQMAFALRDEVNDLESAGISVIQVDEPALREGLPLREKDHKQYLADATQAFRLTTSGVGDETQIHTHMCYAEFGEIVDAVASLDADVISLEAARSSMAIADDLKEGGYAAQVGPGVYDIHSPRVPTVEEIESLLHYALDRIKTEQFWVNPDCGLKTRGESEVVDALTNMVVATKAIRQEIS